MWTYGENNEVFKYKEDAKFVRSEKKSIWFASEEEMDKFIPIKKIN